MYKSSILAVHEAMQSLLMPLLDRLHNYNTHTSLWDNAAWHRSSHNNEIKTQHRKFYVGSQYTSS